MGDFGKANVGSRSGRQRSFPGSRSLYGGSVLFAELIEVLDPEPHAAALNMAIDEALLQRAEQPMLRVYRWRQPALSFGCFGKIAEVERVAAGREVVRRWTGGGIVEHGDDVTYTLIMPRASGLFRVGAPESYRMIHEAIARMLRREGQEAAVVGAAPAKVSDACFANPVQFDLVADGAKIAGAAQRRTRWGLLHQGSIRAEQLPAGLREKLAGVFATNVTPRDLALETQEFAGRLAQEKYGTIAWLRKF